MARAAWVLLFLLPFLALPAVASDVIDATPETIQSLLSKNLLLELYAPWCGHCKSLAPTWEKVATTLKGELAVAKVDCTIHDALCERFEVQGFPTIVFASEGKMHKYAGMRSEEDLLGFARGGWKEAEGVAIGKAVEALPILHLNDTNADSVLFNHTRSLLLCFCASNLPICRYYKKHWLQVGDEFRDVLDIAIIDTSGSGSYHMEQRFNATESPALRYVHNQRVYTFDGEFTVADIAAWLEEGFRNSSSYAVPAPPSQWDKFYRQYLYWPVQDGKTMLNRMPVATGVILAAGTLCGILFSVVLGLLVQPKQKVN